MQRKRFRENFCRTPGNSMVGEAERVDGAEAHDKHQALSILYGGVKSTPRGSSWAAAAAKRRGRLP